MNFEEARKHIVIARRHLDKVQSAAWEQDHATAVTWTFYSLRKLRYRTR